MEFYLAKKTDKLVSAPGLVGRGLVSLCLVVCAFVMSLAFSVGLVWWGWVALSLCVCGYVRS